MWDFQHLLQVNALDYFAAPCRCGQCRERYGDGLNARYVSRRNWDQFILFYETLLGVRGSYTQAMFLNDPDVIDVQADAPDSEWQSRPPPLFQWTDQLEALYSIADQVQAGRVRRVEDFKPYPRPVVPAAVERKSRKERKQSSGIDAALARGIEADKWNYL